MNLLWIICALAIFALGVYVGRKIHIKKMIEKKDAEAAQQRKEMLLNWQAFEDSGSRKEFERAMMRHKH